jgi:DNA repair photolyase
MPRFVSNPPNPWASQHVELLGEPPPAELTVYEERAKSIVASNDSPDIPFRYSVNPYRGCFHACAYCYARPGHQHLGFGAGTDFDRRIVVKTNAAELLRKRFLSRAWRGDLLAFSGVTDCYQPLEAGYGLTRACLSVCLEFRNPVAVVTKGALVRRDAALLADLAREAAATVTWRRTSHELSHEPPDAARRLAGQGAGNGYRRDHPGFTPGPARDGLYCCRR